MIHVNIGDGSSSYFLKRMSWWEKLLFNSGDGYLGLLEQRKLTEFNIEDNYCDTYFFIDEILITLKSRFQFAYFSASEKF